MALPRLQERKSLQSRNSRTTEGLERDHLRGALFRPSGECGLSLYSPGEYAQMLRCFDDPSIVVRNIVLGRYGLV